MGWMTELATVYNNLMKRDTDDKPLPLYHIKNNAPLVITLDGNGKFLNAKLLGNDEKDKWPCCMPSTEESAARAGAAVRPYPLCDKLEYVARDYASYLNFEKMDAKKAKKASVDLKEKYKQYITQLQNWVESEYTSEKLRAILNYVKQGTVVSDLLSKIYELQETTDIEKYNFFVRWVVEIPDEIEIRTWKDKKIQQLWINYYSHNCINSRGLCYGLGDNILIANFHSKKIRNAGDGAKIVSSNDEQNYTFRGRFNSADEAVQISMELTDKAHKALQWLISKQGSTIGNGLTVVAWCEASDVKPLLLNNAHSMGFDDDVDEDASDTNYTPGAAAVNSIINRLRGYYSKVAKNDKILVMAINAASPGRMSILLYRQYSKSEYEAAQEHWHFNLAWYYSYWDFNNKKWRHTISSPSPKEIAIYCYGKNANDNMQTEAIERLLPCIIDKKPIPKDIETLLFNRASRLVTLEKSERDKTLETACAVIKYNYNYRAHLHGEEGYEVELDENNGNRDYLFGRLLALADRIESTVLDDQNVNRESNAIRLMPHFVKYPCSTWQLLYSEKLRPYFKQLKQSKPGLCRWFENTISEVTIKFKDGDYADKDPLSGEFLLGYHCQQKYRKNNENATDDGDNTMEDK
ncbi:MAG: type I-C CRISPR-associated protein Cas8c/Csd1 [Spirochaetaceae bacterium]|jgi:CRISPR-associated protein Csd1|nr:type I-C CRISPR-associated protein Cas8c/Csd1 [Spirochaetaceae bacterium]